MTSPALRAVAFVAAIVVIVVSGVLGRDGPAPYVITAIDYHFHDAHPSFPIAPGSRATAFVRKTRSRSCARRASACRSVRFTKGSAAST